MGLCSVANSRRNYCFPAPGDLSMGQMGNGPSYRDGVVFCSRGVSLPKRPYNLATRGRCLY